MGIPEFHEILKYNEPKRCGYAAVYLAGIILWYLLLKPLTNPELYSNDLFWVSQLMWCNHVDSTMSYKKPNKGMYSF